MRQPLASIFKLPLTAANRVALDPQTKVEIDEWLLPSRRPAFAIALYRFRSVEA